MVSKKTTFQGLGLKQKRFYHEGHEGHEEKRLNSLTTRSRWSLKDTKKNASGSQLLKS